MYKIGIDLTPLKNAHASRGIGKYTNELLEAIKTLGLRDIEIAPYEKENCLKTNTFDLLHYPYFDLFFHTLPFKRKIPVVVTVHDVIPLLFPSAYPPGVKGKINHLLQKLSLRSVEMVITDSQNSKNDIVEHLQIPEPKIKVIYLAPSLIFQQLEKGNWEKDLRKKYQLPENFVLYVGDVNWNKNLISLANACKKIKNTLVIVGKQATNENFDKSHVENQPLLELLNKFGNDPQVRRLGYVPDEDLVKIYNLANVYCLPSLYEGFGLSILEAMACGCPVVCSNTSSLPEIGDEAIVKFDPKNVDDIANSLKSVLNNKNLEEELIRKGLGQVKKYSWKKTAIETTDVYRSILERKR